MRRTMFMGAAAAALLGASPAHAQIWIGQIVGNMMAAQQAAEQEHRCMMGTPMKASEIDEVRQPANEVMANYAAAVGGGDWADIHNLYQRGDPKAVWVSGKAVARIMETESVKDPFAALGAKMDPEPRSLIRAGDGKMVQGQWLARGSDGMPVGIYDAGFVRVLGVWRLRWLILNPADAAQPTQFCHLPGDVEPYKVKWEAQQKKIEAKRAAKAARKAALEAAGQQQ